MQIQPTAMEVDGVAESFPITKATGLPFDALNPAAHALGMAVVDAQHRCIQDAPQITAQRLPHLDHRRQAASLGKRINRRALMNIL